MNFGEYRTYFPSYFWYLGFIRTSLKSDVSASLLNQYKLRRIIENNDFPSHELKFVLPERSLLKYLAHELVQSPVRSIFFWR